MEGLTPEMRGYAALALMVLLTTTGQLFLKGGSQRIDFSRGFVRGLRSMANFRTLLGGVTVVAAPLLYMYALSLLPLSTAYGFTGLGYVGVVLGSRIVLEEKITLYHIYGSLVILSGLILWNGPSIFPS